MGSEEYHFITPSSTLIYLKMIYFDRTVLQKPLKKQRQKYMYSYNERDSLTCRHKILPDGLTRHYN